MTPGCTPLRLWRPGAEPLARVGLEVHCTPLEGRFAALLPNQPCQADAAYLAAIGTLADMRLP